MINVGDKVKCINDGLCYDTYEVWVMKYAPKYHIDYLKSKYTSLGDKISKNALGVIGSVVALAPHLSGLDVLVLVKDEVGDVFLIGINGLSDAE